MEPYALRLAVGALLTFFTPGWKPTWIRTSSDGLEWSAAGADPRHLRWDDIAGVQVRRRFLRWVLEVTPAGTEQVFAVDLTRVSPGPCALRAEISRWEPASSRQNT